MKTSPSYVNTTAAWLAKQVADHGLYEYLHRAMLASASFAREDVSEVEDHINNAFAAWIKRDSFASYLAAGKTPNRRHLVSWAKQVSSNTMRDRGTDCLHRELRGARTELERSEYADGMAPWVAQQTTAYEKVTLLSDEDGADTGDYDLVDLDAVDATELLARSELVDTMERVFDRACPRSKDAAARLNDAFGLMAEEASNSRLAGELGVSELRAEKLSQRVRDRLRESEARVQEALSVLRAVGDEPFVTRDEVRDMLSDLSDLPSTVEELVERGYMSEHAGGSLRLTEKGEVRLAARGEWGDRLLL